MKDYRKIYEWQIKQSQRSKKPNKKALDVKHGTLIIFDKIEVNRIYEFNQIISNYSDYFPISSWRLVYEDIKKESIEYNIINSINYKTILLYYDKDSMRAMLYLDNSFLEKDFLGILYFPRPYSRPFIIIPTSVKEITLRKRTTPFIINHDTDRFWGKLDKSYLHDFMEYFPKSPL